MRLNILLCNFSITFLIIVLVISGFNYVNGGYRGGSGGYRSGGGGYRSGGGGYRSGSKTQVKVKVRVETKTRFGGGSNIRSGYRSGPYSRIGVSNRYVSWSRYHGFSPDFRYRSSSYYYKHRGISMGLIIMSHRHRRSFIIDRESSYDEISICYNEFALYDRNISQSPWFVCPWDDPRDRYCCGNEVEERCCRYFERSGHLAGLIVGLLIIVALLISIGCCCYCSCNKRRKSSGAIVYIPKDENKQEQFTLIPAEHVQYNPNPPVDVIPTYPETNAPHVGYSPYLLGNEYNQNQQLQFQPNVSPYPPANTYGQENPPYPMNPVAPQFNPMGYDQSSQNNQFIPPGNPPPSYSGIGKSHY